MRHRSRALPQHSLRQRLLALFAGLAAGFVCALVAGLYFGYQKTGTTASGASALDAIVIGGVVAGCLVLALIFALWWLFDQHVARPVERLAGELRAHAHSDIRSPLESMDAPYLGDLAPATQALLQHFNEARNALAEAVARETARLSLEQERLAELLGDLPAGVLACTADHRLTFYNGEALRILKAAMGSPPDAASTSPQPLLGQPIFDFIDETSIRQAHAALLADPRPDAEHALNCPLCEHRHEWQASMRLLGGPLCSQGDGTAGYVLVFRPADLQTACPSDTAPRHVVYDFELLDRAPHDDLAQTPLDALTYVVFDTETTGLLPSQGDEIVQLAALRIVNGRKILTETLESYVKPGRSIPASSTRIHGITDAMVADAPSADCVVKAFHRYCQGAVIVAHNAPFDMAFLKRHECGPHLRFDGPVIDTVVLSAIVFGEAEQHDLDSLTARLGISIPPGARHTAMGDTLATADALLKLLPPLKARGLLTLGDLEREMRRHQRLKRSGGHS